MELQGASVFITIDNIYEKKGMHAQAVMVNDLNGLPCLWLPFALKRVAASLC